MEGRGRDGTPDGGREVVEEELEEGWMAEGRVERARLEGFIGVVGV